VGDGPLVAASGVGSCRASAHLPPSSSGIGGKRRLQPAAEARVPLVGSDGGVPLVATSAADRAGQQRLCLQAS
jgi:hypothetical protein